MKVFLVLYPFKFRLFDEKRFEFDLLKKKNNVIIFEFIDLIFPYFVKAYKKEKKIKNLYKIKSLFEFHKEFRKIKKKNKELVIFNFLKNDSLKCVFIQIYLKFFFIKKVDFINPGTSLENFFPKIRHENIIKKTFSYIKRFNITLYKIKIYFLKFLTKIFNIRYDYIFLSGKSILNKISTQNKKKIIKGHSWDFSQNLSRENKKIFNRKYAVYIDAPGPKFLSDSFLFKEKLFETSDHTYPLLRKFFNYIEKRFSLNVVVAPHPKTKIRDKSSLFGYRKVISDNTKNLIKYSSLVITRNSTAVSFACYYKKPIILFYTNQTLNTEAQESTEYLARSLKLQAINLDNFKKYKLKKIINFNKSVYDKYLYNYCTFKNLSEPNYKIWSKFKFFKN